MPLQQFPIEPEPARPILTPAERDRFARANLRGLSVDREYPATPSASTVQSSAATTTTDTPGSLRYFSTSPAQSPATTVGSAILSPSSLPPTFTAPEQPKEV